MVLAMYSILPAVIKWRPTNDVVYTFAKMCVKSIFFRFLLIQQVTLSNYTTHNLISTTAFISI